MLAVLVLLLCVDGEHPVLVVLVLLLRVLDKDRSVSVTLLVSNVIFSINFIHCKFFLILVTFLTIKYLASYFMHILDMTFHVLKGFATVWTRKWRSPTMDLFFVCFQISRCAERFFTLLTWKWLVFCMHIFNVGLSNPSCSKTFSTFFAVERFQFWMNILDMRFPQVHKDEALCLNAHTLHALLLY